ncbi:hypothetical protein [Siculibacillus lacustris]|uniref:hypothetical protein n=1 Tax=Siculibacillus lacustris TaxID=1549641 RepID=UPI0013F16E78|nr:hypothetical protein [Siculibacillus lacustris]
MSACPHSEPSCVVVIRPRGEPPIPAGCHVEILAIHEPPRRFGPSSTTARTRP